MMPDPIRILHLSDLHFGAGASQAIVLKALAQDIADLTKNRPPHLVAITGDIAHDGKPASYRMAEQWITEDLRPATRSFHMKNLLIVPGNHDVNFDRLTMTAQRAQCAAFDSLKKPTAQDLKRLAAGHGAYFKFIENTMGARAPANPWWRRRIRVGHFSVDVLGIWSSWMCRGHDEPGSLLIGQWQLDELLSPLQRRSTRASLKIALLHHPWEFLKEDDREGARRRLGNECDLILRGHLHKGRAYAVETPDCRWIELEAGAGAGHRDAPNGYQLVEFHPDTKKTSVHYRLWHNDEWVADKNCYRAMSDGRVDLYLYRRSPGHTGALTVSETYRNGRHIRVLTWQRKNQSKNANALSEDLLADITAAIADAPPNTIIVLAGSREYFSSGLDMREMRRRRGPKKHLNLLMNLFEVMGHRAPIVSIVRGPAAGGGAGIALFSHFVIAGKDAKFVIPGHHHYRPLARLLIPLIRRRRPLDDQRIDQLLDESSTRQMGDIEYGPGSRVFKSLVSHTSARAADELDGLVDEAVDVLDKEYFAPQAWDFFRKATTAEYVRCLRLHWQKDTEKRKKTRRRKKATRKGRSSKKKGRAK